MFRPGRRTFLKAAAALAGWKVAPGAAGRRYAYVQWDVFSAEPLKGNPLAVFTDARGLSDSEMQALARETNLSETTFIVPRAPAVEKESGVRVRIFTAREELPFAGHPTLGTAMAIRAGRQRAPAEVVLDLKGGKTPVFFHTESDGKVFGEMRQRDAQFGETYSRDVVAPLIGLQASDIADDVPTQSVSTGLDKVILPLRSLAAIRSLRVNFRGVSELLGSTAGRNFYFVTRETEDPKARLHARQLFEDREDPATGSAAGCAAAWMVKYGVARLDEQVLIEQGAEVHRQGRIFVRAARQGENIVNVRVGGHAVEVLRGEFLLDSKSTS
jgi:trans-2,3-dihydro-3-hydroxyanthranilate isomerase